MPLLSPNINAALQAAGLQGIKDDSPDIRKQLDRAGLSTDEILSQIQQEMVGAESAASRLKAAEMGLKMQGHLKEAQVPIPSITIVINDPGSQKGINPILLPREISLVS